MRTVSVEDVEPRAGGAAGERRELSEPLGTTDVAINRYCLSPGERLSSLHAHIDQEEVFVVIAGKMTFETLDGKIAVEAGGAVRFAPGEFQSGTNVSDDPVTVLALGAPRDSEDVRVPIACPDCGHGATRPALGERGEVLRCPECGADSPVECPECGDGALQAVLGENGTPVSRCVECGAVSTQQSNRAP